MLRQHDRALAFLVTLVLMRNRRYPAALFVIGLGVIYALLFTLRVNDVLLGVGVRLPHLSAPTASDVLTGLLVLALPQIPLSLETQYRTGVPRVEALLYCGITFRFGDSAALRG